MITIVWLPAVDEGSVPFDMLAWLSLLSSRVGGGGVLSLVLGLGKVSYMEERPLQAFPVGITGYCAQLFGAVCLTPRR